MIVRHQTMITYVRILGLLIMALSVCVGCAGVPLIVTVLALNSEDAKWAVAGVRCLARAYGDNAPDYTTADLKPQ